MNCPSCGEDTGPGHRFCSACGQALVEEEELQAGERPKKAVERVAGALEAYRRHGAPWVELARQYGAKGLLSASLARVTTAAMKEYPDLWPHASPEGTVTLAFSDIEGSTAANERLGDQRWMEILRTHNAIVREQLPAHGGHEVKCLGDGFMLAFSSARKGVSCAIDVQRAFQAHGEAHPDEALAVRFGLHTGEVLKEDGDFFGADVAMAARVAEVAKGGQILVSDVVKELVESTGGFQFGRPRKASLKGLPGSHVVHEVLWRPQA